jgi:hypothetical protein
MSGYHIGHLQLKTILSEKRQNEGSTYSGSNNGSHPKDTHHELILKSSKGYLICQKKKRTPDLISVSGEIILASPTRPEMQSMGLGKRESEAHFTKRRRQCDHRGRD